MEDTPPPASSKGAGFFRHCKHCAEPKDLTEFAATILSAKGKRLYRHVCHGCRRKLAQQRRLDARASVETYATVLVKRARDRARRRGFDNVSLTEGWVVAQWDKQGGNCFYSGEAMELSSGPYLVTVERLNVAKGYEPENCVLACLCVNMMRASIPMGEFKWWCAKVAKNAPMRAVIPEKTSDKNLDD